MYKYRLPWEVDEWVNPWSGESWHPNGEGCTTILNHVSGSRLLLKQQLLGGKKPYRSPGKSILGSWHLATLPSNDHWHLHVEDDEVRIHQIPSKKKCLSFSHYLSKLRNYLQKLTNTTHQILTAYHYKQYFNLLVWKPKKIVGWLTPYHSSFSPISAAELLCCSISTARIWSQVPLSITSSQVDVFDDMPFLHLLVRYVIGTHRAILEICHK